MSIIVDPVAARPRSRGFGTLTAGMMLRGKVPDQLLFGPTCAVPQPQRALRDTPWPDPAPVLTPSPQPEPASTPEPKPAAPAVKAKKKRRAMTVRLDDAHHMRLRLVSTFTRRSAQDLFVTALDAYLDQLPSSIPGNCTCMKAQAEPGSR